MHNQMGANRRVLRRKSPNQAQSEGQTDWFLNSLYTANSAFVLPRPIPTWVQPHTFPAVFTMLTQPGDYGALIIRPDMVFSVEQFVNQTASGNVAAFQFGIGGPTGFVSNANRQCLGVPFLLDAAPVGGTGIATAATVIVPNFPGYDRWGPTGQRYLGQLGYHPGTYSIPGVSSFVVYNPDSATMTITIGISSYSPATNTVTDINTMSGSIAGHSQGSLTFATAPTASDLVFWFEITNSSVLGHVPSGMSISAADGVLTYVSDGNWQVSSLPDLIGNQTILNQFLSASSYSITAASAILHNTTPKVSKGGSIAIAQLPGGDIGQLPRNALQIYQFLNGLEGRIYRGGELSEGASWNYVPEKWRDWEFKPIPNDQAPIAAQYIEDRPYMCCAWRAPAASDIISPTELTVVINMCVEYQTTGIEAPLFHPGPDLHGLAQVYLALAACELNVGCNPDHLERIKNTVKRIATNPTFQKIAKEVLKSAGQVAMRAVAQAAASALL
jgi:hypothetical protein